MEKWKMENSEKGYPFEGTGAGVDTLSGCARRRPTR